MSKYVEEYLVSLGFDIETEEGKKYVKQLDEIRKTAEKASKASQTQNKQISQDGKTMAETQKQFGSLLKSFDEAKKNPLAYMTKTVFQMFDHSTVNKMGEFSKGVQKVDKQFSNAEKSSAGLLKNLVNINKTGAPEVAAGEGSGMLAAAAPAAPAVAVAGIAVAAAAGIAAFAKLNMNIVDAETDAITLSRKMWMSTEAARDLMAVTNAMGESDLADIGYNTVLLKRFEELSRYQREQLALPKDYEKMIEPWNKLETSIDKAKLQLGYYLKLLPAAIKPFDVVLSLIDPLGPAGFGIRTALGIKTTANLLSMAPKTAMQPIYPTASSSSTSTNNNVNIQVYGSTDPQKTA